MAWKISWWTVTGKVTPFDENGVTLLIYRNLETGEELSSRKLPIGACYEMERRGVPDNDWCRKYGDETGKYPWAGYDGKAIACKLPSGGWWHIDGRCSNCTLPNDNTHRCWVRHGTIGELLTVDKNGKTCGGGAGSIIDNDRNGNTVFHGFLRNGVLA